MSRKNVRAVESHFIQVLEEMQRECEEREYTMRMCSKLNSEQRARANRMLTQNGALCYSSTTYALVDLNASVNSLRNATPGTLACLLENAYREDPMLCVKLIFHIGDIRKGKGERKVFNMAMDWLCREHLQDALAVLPLIPEYTRWDYLVRLVASDSKEAAELAGKLVVEQFGKDLAVIRGNGRNKNISLLAKWMPSLQVRKPEGKVQVRVLLRLLGMQEREYRHVLSELRAHLNVIEKSMSANRPEEIDFEKLTSWQQLRYRGYLERRLQERHLEYLEAVNRGERKMNVSVLNPVDIVYRYGNWMMEQHRRDLWMSFENVQEAAPHPVYETMWNMLPDMTSGNSCTMVIRDGSGSMYCNISGDTHTTCLDAADAMTLYCAEKMQGAFHNKFITFSAYPKLLDVSGCESLQEKLHFLRTNDDCSNTNLQATFRLILQVAQQGELKQEELPKYLLILSDMEFDDALGYKPMTLFDAIRAEWHRAGYELPTLVFWSLNSKRRVIPEIASANGIIYLDGFSTNELTHVMAGDFEQYVSAESGELSKTAMKRIVLSPREQLQLVLDSPRYDAVEAALQKAA